MSSIMQAMMLLKTTFVKYAGKDGDAKTLTKAELSELLRAEMIVQGSQAEADKFFANLDSDKSGTVDFQEYITFVACLYLLLNEN